MSSFMNVYVFFRKEPYTMAEARNTAKRKSDLVDSTLLQLKKLKASDSTFGENASFSLAHDRDPVDLSAREGQKPEPTLPLASAKKEKKKKKKNNNKTKQTTIGLEQKPSDLEEKLETVLPLESVPKNKNKTNRVFQIQTTRRIFKEQLKGNFYVKDQCLDELLEKLSRSIEAMEQPKKDMAFKIWMKQHFSVGVNEVTRMLERMPTVSDKTLEIYISDFECPQYPFSNVQRELEESLPDKDIIGSETETQRKKKLLQAVLIAVDCHPCALVSHFPSLASSRGVPLFSAENHGSCAERLGKLLKVKTALAIGVKVGESPINKAIQDAIDDQVSRLNSSIACESQAMTTE